MGNLLTVEDLSISFDNKKVVSNLNFEIKAGEIFCLVGESGSGKSLTALSILKLLPEYAKFSCKSFNFKDIDLNKLSEKEMQQLRGKEISMIFQEPMTSLNPVLKVSTQVMESLILHQKLNKKEAYAKCIELFYAVGIAKERLDDYPHQLSGGMRQRVMIAMALACSPSLLIADEPTTALDVTIQGQILNLLSNLVKKNNMSLLLITHDLGVVSEIADTVAVMYAGEILEKAPVADFFKNPKHPYSKALMACVPTANPTLNLPNIEGTVPFPTENITECKFLPRCKESLSSCTGRPKLNQVDNSYVRCFLYANDTKNK